MKQIGFAFGIRTVRSFSVEDKLGAIIDEILYSDGSEFNEKMFPEVRDNYNTKVLFDPVRQNKFTVTPQDFVFEYNVMNNFEKEFEKYLKNFNKVILNGVFSKFKISNISRFGFIIKSELEGKNKFLEEISGVINKYNGDEDSLSMRFNVITKKPLKLSTLITEDYDNEIITYDRINSDSPLIFSLDFQKYFKPELNIIDDATISFDKFCNDSLSVFKKKYSNEV
jgi:hypothetical protein